MKLTTTLTCLIINNLVLVNPVVAQIAPDNTLGDENSRVENRGNRDIINGGATRGENLFHSFREFNVEAGRGAYFENPAAIRNILSRVTGNNLSNIQGVLGVLGNANLFLINPNGIIFGPNARLDMNGSFFGSSANSIVFSNFEFSTINPEAPPLLTINIPVGLTFRERAERIIARNSRLAVQPGQTIALIGGNVNLENSNIETPGGRIELGAVATGEITLNEDLSVNYPQTVSRSNISLTDSTLNVRSDGGGEISINSRDLNLRNSSVIGGISAEANAPEATAGDIRVSATRDIELDGGEIINNVQGRGNGGNIEITSDSLQVINGSRISANTFAQGNTGNILIEVSGLFKLDRGESESFTGVSSVIQPEGMGNAGDVEIKADSVEVVNGTEVRTTTFGQGEAGSIVIEAEGLVKFDGGNRETFTGALSSIELNGVGRAGNVEIKAGSVEVLNGAQIGANTLGEGNAGRVAIEADGLVKLDAVDSDLMTLTGVASGVNPGAVGNAGGVEIRAGSVEVINGAQIIASTFGEGDGGSIVIEATDSVKFDGEESVLFTGAASGVNPGAVGNAGDVQITANSVEVVNGAAISADTFGEGNGGSIVIEVTGLVKLDGGEGQSGFLTGVSSTVGPNVVGNAEGVEIRAGSVEVLNGAQVSASTFGEGDGGSVVIEAEGLVKFEGFQVVNNTPFPSGAGSSVGPGAIGNSGNVEIRADSLEVINDAVISADTFGEGDGGSVVIEVTDLVKLDGGESEFFTGVSSSVALPNAVGDAGGVEIRANSLEVINGAQISSSTFGQGNGGSVVIEAEGFVKFDGFHIITVNNTPTSIRSGAGSSVQPNAVGKAGNVQIIADSVRVINGAVVSASTFGEGDAGSVLIEAEGLVKLDAGESESNTGISSNVGPNVVGNAGGVEIRAGSVEILNGAQIGSGTFGFGDGGIVLIEAEDLVKFEGFQMIDNTLVSSGTFSNVQSNAVGDAGNVQITADSVRIINGAVVSASTLGLGDAGNMEIRAGSLEVLNGAQIIANTFGEGDGGSVAIEATDSVKFDGEESDIFTGVSSGVEPEAIGDAGGVEIRAGSLEVLNGAQIGASTFGFGNAGSVVIKADGLIKFDRGFASSGVNSQAVGNAGGVEVRANSLEVINGSEISASTLGQGDAGSVVIEADGLVKFDRGFASSDVNSGALGNAGGIAIRADSVEVTHGAVISASTDGEGNAGNITITSNNFTADRSGSVRTNTSTFGIAGDITLRIQDNLNLTGSTIEAATTETSTGAGGSIVIDSSNILLRDNANISVNSQGQGDGGDISLSARDLKLEDNSQISAATASGTGGNIILTVPGITTLRDSNISATAMGTGDGGNLTIETNFLILKNSNLTANAVQGDGGNIDITTRQIFSDRDQDIAIMASSEFGLDGTVTINTLEIDPEEALVDLYQNPVDPEQLIGQDFCRQSSGSEFIITGRGGLPNSPDQLQSVDEVTVGLIEPAVEENTEVNQEAEKPPAVREIVPAMGMIKDEHGNVILVAYPTPDNVSRPPLPQVSCQ